MKSVAIIGAGACGLVLANLLSKNYSVTLIEKNNKLGKKILASGNGKCNFTNTGDYTNKYNNEFALKIVKTYDNEKIRDYFSSLGLAYLVDEENRAYPLSETSTSLLEVLKKGLKGVRILLDSRVNRLESNKNNVSVYYNDVVEDFDYVVCCSGSSASNLGSDYAYFYLQNYGIEFTSLRGSLTPIKVEENLKGLSGVRVKCLVSLYKNNEFIYKESGEVLFKDEGLSGIVIYNISSMINRHYDNNYEIILDLNYSSYNRVSTSDLTGVVHPKILEYLKKNNLKDISHLKFKFKDFYPKDNAQVISGGIALKEINDNLSLKKDPHIYVGGEVIDCDGMCGGYNLQFAFSCAFLINESLQKKTSE
jgi:hypothetical protein